ncbi:hypothetical protein PtA15_2A480 [Puccinia triticina]|nr:uncharacterized protein PtA15_2A480 [Puccinia triticina]WAQ82165.1 hypothetical protein PtA15_2A480 [Puccinia triticina]
MDTQRTAETNPRRSTPGNTGVHRVQSQTRGHNNSPISTANRPSRNPRGQQLRDHLCSFFDSDARDKREREQNMTNLYAIQLQDAHTTIHRLEQEIARLRDGVNIQLIRLQDEHTRVQAELQKTKDKLDQAQRDLYQQTSENTNLRSKLEIMQLRMEVRGGTMIHHQQPQGGFYGSGFSGPSRMGTGGFPSQSTEPRYMGSEAVLPSEANEAMGQDVFTSSMPAPRSGTSFAAESLRARHLTQ